jgi:glycosyltransferase involved in cell wall biosynthesis
VDVKVLFCSRADVFEALGGDTVQLLETKAALERRGIVVDVATVPDPDARAYDLVHVFNTQLPATGLAQIRSASRQGRKVALSTIYWDLDALYRSRDHLTLDHKLNLPAYYGPRILRAKALLLRLRIEYQTKYLHMVRQMLVESDVLLPNSVAELELLAHQMDYTMARAKAFIVPNAVKAPASQVELSQTSKALLDALPDRYVLEAARIETVKGQLQLLRAVARFCPDIPLVFVGGGNRSSAYFEAFDRARAKHGNAHYVGIVPHDELPAFYARAKVHALPSLRESPGLATLEAGLAGVNCVVGIHAPVQEYFGADAWVCDPEDVDSIGQAIKAAWISPSHGRMRERIQRDFTWDRAAQATLQGYEFLLGCKLGAPIG